MKRSCFVFFLRKGNKGFVNKTIKKLFSYSLQLEALKKPCVVFKCLSALLHAHYYCTDLGV